jgi:hypothetical protein
MSRDTSVKPEELINSPVFFGRWLLRSCEPQLDSQGFMGWAYEAGMFDELPIDKSPDGIYNTDQMYEVFKAQYQPTSQELTTKQ